MDYLYTVLKYIFKKNDHEINFDSIDSFFEDGLSFPTFVSIIFNDDDISGINKAPEGKYDKKVNNDNAYRYILKNNESLRKIYTKFEVPNDKVHFLESILTNQCFVLDHKKILDICNSIVQPLGINYKTEKDLLNVKNLITILHVLTDGKVPNITDEDADIDDLLQKSFKEAKVPLILDSEPLDDQNQFKFYIQTEIIFELLSNKIPRLNSEVSSSSELIQLHEIPKSKKRSNFFNFLRKQSDSDHSTDTSEYYSDDDDEEERENENMQNVALLKTINAIGSKSGIQFNSFESAVKDDAIPKFVMKFFNCDTIKNVHISEEPKTTKIFTNRLTKQQLSNIEAVIEFIKTKKEKFKILLFDFEDIKNIEASTILFYTNFLNCFFITKMKQEMYQKTVRLLCSHTSRFNENYNSFLFTKYKIYPCLLHFLTNRNLHFPFNYHKVKFTDELVEPYFLKANVPMIINRKLLMYSKKYVSFPIFYQLQFIFDAFDNAPSSCFIVDALMSTLFLLKRLKVPKFSEIASSIKAKQLSLKYQSEMSNKYRTNSKDLEEQKYIKKERKEISKPKTFAGICNEKEEDFITKTKELIESKKNDFDSKLEFKQFNEFWNSPDSNYKNDNGIIYKDKKSSHKSKKKSSPETDWNNEILSIKESIEKKEKRNSISNKNNDQLKQSLMFSRRKSGYEPKLHKLFTYNENEFKWEFIPSNFNTFSNEKKINVKDSKAPLILFFNSYEEDLKLINSSLINTIYPNLEKENKDEIFVYALCDRSLTMLNFVVDFNNPEKASIKPIFLLLHVPKSKENLPNIRLILTQIYSFLSTICDFEVTILNSKRYLDQIEFVKDILKINKHIELLNSIDNTNNNSNEEDKPLFSFVYQPPSSSDLLLDKSSLKAPENENNNNDDENDDDDKKHKKGKKDNNEDNVNHVDDFYPAVYKDPKFVFLVNDSSIQFSRKIDSKLNSSEFFKNLISKINKETYLYYVNVIEPETYESFLNCMNDIIMKKCCTFGEIDLNLKCIEKYNFSDLYLQMIVKEDHAEKLEKLIKNRLLMLKNVSENEAKLSEHKVTENKKSTSKNDKESTSGKKKSKSKKKSKKEEEKETKENKEKESTENAKEASYYSMLVDEIKKAVPIKNTEFIRECMSIKKLFEHNDCCNKTIRKLLKENLSICADSHLAFIGDSIGNKYFLKYQQMADMVNAHKMFLKDEFMSMIQSFISEELYQAAFEFNFDIVQSQLKKDQVKIMKLMQPFIDKINIKNCTKIHDLRNTIIEGTNYAMKETENLREVKITVQMNKDLKSEIPQDF